MPGSRTARRPLKDHALVWRVTTLVFVVIVATWLTVWIAQVPVAKAAAAGAIGLAYGFLLGFLEPRQALIRAIIPFTIPAGFIVLVGIGGVFRASSMMWLLTAAVAVEYGRSARGRLRRTSSDPSGEA